MKKKIVSQYNLIFHSKESQKFSHLEKSSIIVRSPTDHVDQALLSVIDSSSNDHLKYWIISTSHHKKPVQIKKI